MNPEPCGWPHGTDCQLAGEHEKEIAELRGRLEQAEKDRDEMMRRKQEIHGNLTAKLERMRDEIIKIADECGFNESELDREEFYKRIRERFKDE